MEVMERVCQSAYGTYIRGVTTVAARYIGHPAVAIPASEMVKTMMEEAALPVNRPFVTITNEQMESLKIQEKKGEKEYIKTKDKREERERLHFSKPIRDMGLLWNRMWGYEDDAPVAGQPFYDIVELYGDFKRATNDFSDYLEKEINDWAKGLDEDYKNRELAKPASMRSDFGDAITGLTSGKEDNLSFGGKAGAFLRGLLVDGCGKLLIKDTLLAASSPCDTAKSVMETVKLVGDMDEEDFSKIAKEIKTTWDEASEEEKLNYTGQAGAIVADFLIAKKLKLSKQVKVVETGVKASSKVDNLLEAGVKTGSKVDDIAEAGMRASSKADDITEAGTKVTSKVDDIAGTGAKAGSKADDVAEARAKTSSKVDDIAETGAKASSKVDDTAKAAGQTTAKTVARVESRKGKGRGGNVETSPAVTETKLDKVTSTETKYEVVEPKGGDKPPEIKHMSTNAREFEGLYNEGKINILDFVNECRQIDNVLDAEFLEKVEKMRKLIPGPLRSKGNFGYATVEIDGLEKTEFFAHSRIHTLDNREKFKEDVVKRLKDISLQSKKQEFETLKVNNKNIINGEKHYDRIVDTESKILEEINTKLKGNVDTTGKIIVYTDLYCCPSCQYVFKQFKEKYPKIDVTIIYKQLEF